jgi:hypothetical protein
MEKAFEEGQGPHRAVEPVMMMTGLSSSQSFMISVTVTPQHKVDTIGTGLTLK